jgi:hypothetical protein
MAGLPSLVPGRIGGAVIVLISRVPRVRQLQLRTAGQSQWAQGRGAATYNRGNVFRCIGKSRRDTSRSLRFSSCHLHASFWIGPDEASVMAVTQLRDLAGGKLRHAVMFTEYPGLGWVAFARSEIDDVQLQCTVQPLTDLRRVAQYGYL